MTTRAEYLHRELAELQHRWEGGDYTALMDAMGFCHVTGAPIPAWMANAVLIELHSSFVGGTTAGRGRTGGHAARSRMEQKHEERHFWAAAFLSERGRGGAGRLIDGKPMTREDAFRLASEHLRGTPAQGSVGAIKYSYDRVRHRLGNSGNYRG